MIIERMEFRLKFGKAKEAIEIWKKILEEFKKHKDAPRMRMLTDITGTSYTLVLELELRSLIDMGFKNYQWMTTENVAELYKQFVPLCDSSCCTLYNLEAQS